MNAADEIRAYQMAFYAWNAAIRNARAEYEAHPIVACRGTATGDDGRSVMCGELRQDGDDYYCRSHRAEADKRNKAARERRAQRRAEK